MSLSTHILDTSTGLPASGVQMELVALDVASKKAEETPLETATTDDDGRHRFTVDLEPGSYRLRFATGEYFADAETLYPFVDIHFTVTADGPSHLHVPLLLSPFSYSTYRGS